ncbi:MAG: helix-turn-helix transcriptional regulator [Clostridia bacterium]|nr:helix-turn-helix transcriptional regulator [Clostridia bacterium]
MSFQSKMIKLRKQKGLTQDTFAETIGVSRQAVYKWESAASYPEVDKLLKIARLFGVTVDDMLNDEMDVDREGKMRPVEEVRAEEEELARKKEERRRRRAENKARREAEAAAQAEEGEAPQEEPVAEEVPQEEPVKEEAAPAAPEKKGGFFGFFRRKK